MLCLSIQGADGHSEDGGQAADGYPAVGVGHWQHGEARAQDHQGRVRQVTHTTQFIKNLMG